MRRTRYIRRLWLAWMLTLWLGPGLGGCLPQGPSPIIVLPDSDQVFLGEPNQPATAPWPYVVVSRERYQQLVRYEMTFLADPKHRPVQ